MKEEDFPDKVRELVEQNREKEFQMTYQDKGFLYLMKGYGKQETGGYSIQVQDLSLWDNAIHLETNTSWAGRRGRTNWRTFFSLPCH